MSRGLIQECKRNGRAGIFHSLAERGLAGNLFVSMHREMPGGGRRDQSLQEEQREDREIDKPIDSMFQRQVALR